MFFSFAGRIAPIAAVAALVLTLASCSKTEPYEFTTATAEVAMGTTVVEVRLKDTKSGTFVENAVITATRLDMTPGGMSEMTSPIEPQGSSGPGVFRFGGNFKMAGQWRLSLSAQVPGQAQPVQGTVVLNVK